MRGNEGERKQTSQKNRNTVEVSVSVFEENGMLHVFTFSDSSESRHYLSCSARKETYAFYKRHVSWCLSQCVWLVRERAVAFSESCTTKQVAANKIQKNEEL